MPNYFLKIKTKRDAFNAEGKAPADVEKTLLRAGYKPLTINTPRWDDHWGLLARWHYRHLPTMLQGAEELFIQYPFYAPHVQLVIDMLLKKNCATTILIHDLDMLRGGKEESMELLRKARRLIVHTEAMKEFLCQNGFEAGRIHALECFDYLVEHCRSAVPQFGGRCITFAGNLRKSKFLKLISSNEKLSSLQFLLYGASVRSHTTGKNIAYRGRFSPNDLRSLEGDWGLVWDGTSLTTCQGNHGLGEYLRYNASHKLSLYLAAGMPVIVWKESGVAPFVEKNHLGLTIGSLEEIPQRLDNLSEEDFKDICKSAARMGENLRRGRNLLRAISER